MTRRFNRALIGALVAGAMASAAQAPLAQTSRLAGGGRDSDYGDVSGAIHVSLTASGPTSQTLTLGKGKSAIVELPVDARDLLVTNPHVADAVLRTPRRIYVLGVESGQTDAVFFDGMGHRILSLDIRVGQDVNAVAQAINRVVPGGRVHVEAVNASLVLTGMVPNSVDADRAALIAAQFVAKPDQVLNMLSIAGKEQVMLKVRIVEVQRTAIKQLGVNLNAVIGRLGNNQFTFGMSPGWGINGSLIGGATGGALIDTTKGGVVNGSNGLNQGAAMLEAFERVGLVRTLAEPNLTAVSGEAGKFLVGGEFPVPTGQDTTGKVTVEFKPYGVGLGFTPVVLSGGRISIKLSTEVSELSSLGAFSLSAGAGAPTLTIPSLTVRRAETTVELPSGGSMMIAGLLQSTTKQDIDSLPGLTTLPVLGALFRSRDFQSGETELVVIITPYIVEATSPGNLQTPADGLQIASDAQTILMGKLNRVYKAPPAAVAGRTYQGPYGYVIE